MATVSFLHQKKTDDLVTIAVLPVCCGQVKETENFGMEAVANSHVCFHGSNLKKLSVANNYCLTQIYHALTALLYNLEG